MRERTNDMHAGHLIVAHTQEFCVKHNPYVSFDTCSNSIVLGLTLPGP